MSALVRLYPPAWRERYGTEFEALLEERPPSVRDAVDIVLSAIDARLSPQLPGVPDAPTPWSSRLSGASAILGGSVWCAVIALMAIARTDGDFTVPLLAAVGLMLLSLPGRYMRQYARPIALAVAAAGLSVATLFAQVLPWDIWLLVPVGLIAAALGPGAFALAAARAGLSSGTRWRLVALLTLPLVSTVILVGTGLIPESIVGPLVVAGVMPLGIAWIGTGARIATSRASTSMTNAGGQA